ncbi:MAG: Wzy polymerase domain-containing protein [Rhodoferax sp.]|uniref:PglL family O-oligosaccharyltransferase n=1 Tax=Rhodoferax sp. TaxID=50421 RepID=UPI002619B43E|nr:O-antigen ligase family protein [Rhodoferax sp.]MDD5334680.1 Wzy polymerase domain-containing protein [Rhodoferax sp.]
MLALGSITVIFRATGPVVWHGITLTVAALVLVPVLQYGFGLVLLSGTAWISSAYLIGFLLALLTGARWESASPGQLADGLFLAIGMAALLSVALQLHQWLALDLLDAWSMGTGNGRPFANFGQPNQLATFLLWGLLAVVWGLLRRHIGIGTALFVALYMLFGLALTQSRSAWIAVGVLVLASWFWRRLWPDRLWPWLAAGLTLYFAVCTLSLDWLSQALLLSKQAGASEAVRIASELRPLIWSILIDAAWQHPVLGYGWNQVGLAQLTVALNRPPLQLLLAHSHNLFLDLILWCGIPVGLLVSFYLVRWFWLRLRAVSRAEDAVLLLFLLVVGNHALLELPLHYAYFLLPAGLIMGALNVRLHSRPIVLTGHWSLILPCLVSVALLTTIIHDYLRVETSYQELRFEQARIKTESPGKPPDVLLLTQWREAISLSRFEPTSGMSAHDLDWMHRVASTYPGGATIPKLALALALNKQPVEARQWLEKLCWIEPQPQCQAVRRYWADQALKHPELAALPWPDSASVATPP